MEHLWTPWRMEYIQAAKGEPEGCVFCELPEKDDDAQVRILKRGGRGFVILNSYPYNPGHLMVAPLRHTGDLESLDADEQLELAGLLQDAVRALREEMEPHGFNVGMNLGRIAGAGIPDHLHWHVVPRWSGDTNFMPIVGQTRVLPELLDETYRRLRPRF
ncbi:MAG: HIT family protein [Actinomycetota bacterium]